jgi:ATP-dependent helicase HrpB
MALTAKIEARYGNNGFPVSDCLETLVQALGLHSLVALTAPPGSGKTLMIPAALLERLDCRRVFVLEPRRVTARLPALALKEVCGDTVGYQIRFEKLWNDRTRFGYLTHGTALRVFSSRPPGPNDLVLFDEFHERQWEAELLLAHLRHLNPGPKLLIMSATLDRTSLPPETPIVESDGRLHQVSISHETVEPQLMRRRDRLAQLVADRSAEWGSKERGEQLIFLPGLGDIRAVEEKLRADHLSGPIDILHSSLPEKEIRRVVERAAEDGFRRILSTDLAESSVTLPGIKVVIDSGLVRRPSRDELDLGVTLRTVGAPLSSLEQRAGRAGRLGPGFCHRLFTLNEELHREPFAQPQMEEASYKTVCLFLASLRLLRIWRELPWLYLPNIQKMEQARDWAVNVGLLDSDDNLTRLGSQILEFPLEPRLATFIAKARLSGHPIDRIVKWCHALERPPSGQESWTLDDWSRKVDSDGRLTRQVRDRLRRLAPKNEGSLSEALLASFGDTLAQLSPDRAVCANPDQPALGLNPKYPPDSNFAVLLSSCPSGGGGPNSFCTLFQTVSQDAIWEQMFEQIEESVVTFYEPSNRSVKLIREIRLQGLVLERKSEPAQVGEATADLLKANLGPQDFGPDYATLIRRLDLYRQHCLDANVATSDELLHSYLLTVTSWSKGSPQALLGHIRGILPYSLQQDLDRQLPTTIHLPGRRKPVQVRYPADGDPYISSKLQDFMGWRQPRLLGGKIDLVCHLLAPNQRACQITTDLDSFWSGSYRQVRKDLRGRYPKHHWPEDPARNPRR